MFLRKKKLVFSNIVISYVIGHAWIQNNAYNNDL